MSDNKYFDEYKKLTDSGAIVIGNKMKLALARIERYLATYEYRGEVVDKKIAFIENECCNTKGSNANIELALCQKLWISVAFGFYRSDGKRLINECAIIQARGGGKTTLGSALALVHMLIDGEYGADIANLATTRSQASLLFESTRAITNKRGGILDRMKKRKVLRSTKYGLFYEPTNSLMAVKTADYGSLDGLNSYAVIFDELHSYENDFIQVVKDGSSRKRDNYLIWYLSTNGTVREKVFDSYYETWSRLLTNQIDDDSIMPFIYEIDSLEDIKDERNWQKSNPMLDIIVGRESIRKDLELAKDDPIRQAELITKTFNFPMNSYYSYFTDEEADGNKANFKEELFQGNDAKKSRCIIGMDLASVNDICSISFMTMAAGEIQFKWLNFIPRKTVDALNRSDRMIYEQKQESGSLIIHDLDFNNQDMVFEKVIEFVDKEGILPVAIGYDKWSAAHIINLFEQHYGSGICVAIQQNAATLSQPMKQFKELTKAGKISFNDRIATWNFRNVVVRSDANNNIYPNKKKANGKIDVFMSALDAYACYFHNEDELQYYFE